MPRKIDSDFKKKPGFFSLIRKEVMFKKEISFSQT